jgi:hypothetical protein
LAVRPNTTRPEKLVDLAMIVGLARSTQSDIMKQTYRVWMYCGTNVRARHDETRRWRFLGGSIAAPPPVDGVSCQTLPLGWCFRRLGWGVERAQQRFDQPLVGLGGLAGFHRLVHVVWRK